MTRSSWFSISRRVRALALGLSLIGVPLIGGGCFSPEKPVCAFQCGDNGLCPEGYQCRTDGYCHRNGTTTDCSYPDAAASDASLDLSVPDQTPAGDLASSD